MDHISRIAIFLEVVKQQSFAAAARALGMTGPAVSKQVQTLENQLGVRLLHRTTRQVVLTDEGAIYSERARKALEDLTEAENQIQELKACPTGQFRVNAPAAFGRRYLTGPIAEFAKKYPEVELEVDFDDRRVDILGEGYDIVVRIGSLPDSSFIARQIAMCPVILCASPDFINRYGMPRSPEDLLAPPAVIYTQHGLEAEWRYQSKSGEKGSVRLNRQFAANNAEMMLEACLQGIGLAIMPIFAVADHLQNGELVHILPEYATNPESGIYVIFPQNRHLSTKTRLFVDWLSACAKDYPW